MKKKKSRKPASKEPILAAGGIVTRGHVRPLFAVVRLRRQKSWVLPKGKLNRDETALAAARREAIEETGHDMRVREYLGSLAYRTALRPKIVRFWRMEASGRPVSELMKDVSAVRWLPLRKAISKLTHDREKEFLANVGPQALTSLLSKKNSARPSARVAKPKRGDAVERTKHLKRAERRRERKASAVKAAAAAAPVRAKVRVAHRKLTLLVPSPPRSMQTLWRWLGR